MANNERKPENIKQKIKLLKLYEILVKESDESHPLSTYDLIAKLSQEGIDVTRKTLYEDIDVLNANGYEVMQLRKKCNMYYVADRSFDTAEVRILLDAVEASSFITPEKTSLLVDKIANLAGSLRGDVIKKNIAIFDTTKRDNEQIYYNVFNINEAIIERKKISFNYYKLDAKGNKLPMHDSKPYIVSPIATVVSNDNYYLVCSNEKYENVAHFRIDRMEQVTILDEEAVLSDNLKNLDFRKRKKELFSMFMGEEKSVTFEINKEIVEVVFDKFGKSVNLSPYGDNFRFTADIQISDMFYGWCCALGDKIKIIAPKEVREEYVRKLRDVADSYSE
ncbi:MAG: WYL domain-containing protein [Clostridia bacterium]|nr:WYL domain-containing protein [Clostridia bacterium]